MAKHFLVRGLYWDVITHPFPKFNSGRLKYTDVEMRGWTSKFIPVFCVDEILIHSLNAMLMEMLSVYSFPLLPHICVSEPGQHLFK